MIRVIMSCDNDDNQDDLFEPIVINDNDIDRYTTRDIGVYRDCRLEMRETHMSYCTYCIYKRAVFILKRFHTRQRERERDLETGFLYLVSDRCWNLLVRSDDRSIVT